MAKQTRSNKHPAKAKPAPAGKPKTVAKPSTAATLAADAGRNGWATDLVFDVREPKLAVSLRLDADVLRFFRAFGAGYQTRINEVLKAFMHARGGMEGLARPMPPARTKHTGNGNGKRAG
jgi:uncharacterized protein (DUF4415 family)